jgi:hypothetical protein
MANPLKLLALHVHKDSNGEWYVVGTIEQEDRTTATKVYFRSDKRPIFNTSTGELTWEPKE